MRVLLIEDDHATAQSMELMLKSEGFNVYTTDLGQEGADLAKIYDYDLILLDLNLPDINGLEVLRQIRVAKVQTPIMIVSGCTDIEMKVKTFGGGADDYLTKPFHKDELIVRSHAIVRRSKGHAQAIITTGALAINLDAKTVEIDGVKIHLTAREYQILELLSLRKNATLTKEMFLNHLYGGMDEPELKIIDVFICKLRKKLALHGMSKTVIETVWGRGYVLRNPTTPLLAASVERPSAEVIPMSGAVSSVEQRVHHAPNALPTETTSSQRVVRLRFAPLQSSLLKVIAAGASDYQSILKKLRELDSNAWEPSVRTTIHILIKKGLVENRGTRRKASYFLIKEKIAQAS